MTQGGRDGYVPREKQLTDSRLWRSRQLGPADRDALADTVEGIRRVDAGFDFVHQDAPADRLHVVLDGWAARSKLTEDGQRYLPSVMVPGDLCDLDALLFDRLDYAVTALTKCTVAVLPRERLLALIASRPGIAAAFAWLGLAENAVLTEWSMSVGRRSAHERMAHLLCELMVRMTAAGRAEGHSFDLPLTQNHLADALGLTAVHVNRTLQALRASGLITVKDRRARIHDWPALSRMGGFRPDYLHLDAVDQEVELPLPAWRPDRCGAPVLAFST